MILANALYDKRKKVQLFAFSLTNSIWKIIFAPYAKGKNTAND